MEQRKLRTSGKPLSALACNELTNIAAFQPRSRVLTGKFPVAPAASCAGVQYALWQEENIEPSGLTRSQSVWAGAFTQSKCGQMRCGERTGEDCCPQVAAALRHMFEGGAFGSHDFGKRGAWIVRSLVFLCYALGLFCCWLLSAGAATPGGVSRAGAPTTSLPQSSQRTSRWASLH